jgi:hypothetical protein
LLAGAREVQRRVQAVALLVVVQPGTRHVA